MSLMGGISAASRRRGGGFSGPATEVSELFANGEAGDYWIFNLAGSDTIGGANTTVIRANGKIRNTALTPTDGELQNGNQWRCENDRADTTLSPAMTSGNYTFVIVMSNFNTGFIRLMQATGITMDMRNSASFSQNYPNFMSASNSSLSRGPLTNACLVGQLKDGVATLHVNESLVSTATPPAVASVSSVSIAATIGGIDNDLNGTVKGVILLDRALVDGELAVIQQWRNDLIAGTAT